MSQDQYQDERAPLLASRSPGCTPNAATVRGGSSTGVAGDDDNWTAATASATTIASEDTNETAQTKTTKRWLPSLGQWFGPAQRLLLAAFIMSLTLGTTQVPCV